MKKILLSVIALLFCSTTAFASATTFKGHLEKIKHSYTQTKIDEKYEKLSRAVYTLQSDADIDGYLEVVFEEIVGNEVYINWSNLSMPERETIKYKVTVHLNDDSYTYDYANLEPKQLFWLSSKKGDSIAVNYRHVKNEKRDAHYRDDPAEYYDVDYLEIGSYATKNLIGAYSRHPIFKLELNRTWVKPKKKSTDFPGE